MLKYNGDGLESATADSGCSEPEDGGYRYNEYLKLYFKDHR